MSVAHEWIIIVNLTYVERKISSQVIMLVMYCSFIIFIIQNHFIRNILHELAPNSRFGGYFDFCTCCIFLSRR